MAEFVLQKEDTAYSRRVLAELAVRQVDETVPEPLA